MTTLHDLLVLSPKEAARALVAKALRPGIDPMVLDLVPANGLATGSSFTFTIKQKLGLVRHWQVSGSHPFTIERLKWADVFEDGLVLLPTDPPEKISDVLNFLSKSTGVQFDENDFIDAPVLLSDDGTLKILASPKSWRWYGVLDVCFLGTSPPEDESNASKCAQIADPTAAGFGTMLKKMERNRLLGYDARIWFDAANVAFGTPKTWVMDPVNPDAFNVGGGRVVSNGIAKDPPTTVSFTGTPMKVQILLNRRLCTGMKGLLTLYYSRPKD